VGHSATILRGIRLAALATSLAALTVPANELRGEEASIPAAPDFTGRDLKGKSVALSSLLKKGPVLLDFWTTWCAPCKKEMPELDRLHRTYRDKGFQVVAISQDDNRTVGTVQSYIQSKKYQFIVLVDPDKKIGNLYNVRQYPTSFLVAQDRTVRHFAQGYLPGDEKKLESLIRTLVGLGAEEGHIDSGGSQ